MSPRTFLIHGLIAGFVAGILAFGAAYVFGEPSIESAIALEEAAASGHAHGEGARAHGHGNAHDHDDARDGGHSHGDEGGVSRAQQSTAGLATATIVIGVALGGVVGLAAAFALGRLGRLSPAASTALVAVAGFVAFALATWAKYPPNPPATGSGDTIGARTAAYFGFQAVSVLLAVGAVVLGSRLARRGDGWLASVVPAVGWLVLVTAAGLALPAFDEIPGDFPATVLWSFRFSSLITQIVLWGTLTVVLSGLVRRTARAAAARRELIESVRA
ncbi:CbtA family protein [Planomonospora corallina]|uniref:CbtA family protein n=1 Tax=Planomonospora corallina TaxID=1806052 RepID=A0ABV8I4B2_9ACTN